MFAITHDLAVGQHEALLSLPAVDFTRDDPPCVEVPTGLGEQSRLRDAQYECGAHATDERAQMDVDEDRNAVAAGVSLFHHRD